jgi:hypothetical protein
MLAQWNLTHLVSLSRIFKPGKKFWGRSGDDLYSFGPSTITTPAALTASSLSSDVWHRRLGHPGSQSLNHLISNFSLPCNHNKAASVLCDACQKGRHVRLPFARSQSFTYFPFQIIHCDLWTSPITSFTGFEYYLVLMDDYSHYTWTSPLRQKSDAEINNHSLSCICRNSISSFHSVPTMWQWRRVR